MKRLVIGALMGLGIATACLTGAGQVQGSPWHDNLLFIGGICLGVAVTISVIIMQTEQKQKQAEIVDSTKR